MTRIQIFPREGKPIRLDRFEQNVDPYDIGGLLGILQSWAARKRRDPKELRIQAFDQAQGWQEYTIT